MHHVADMSRHELFYQDAHIDCRRQHAGVQASTVHLWLLHCMLMLLKKQMLWATWRRLPLKGEQTSMA